MSPKIDPRILDVRIQHRRHTEVLAELNGLIAVAKSYGGAIIPLLGPTRCGKTEVLADAKTQFGSVRSGPGSLIETNSFAVGCIPPKPNDRDIYLAMLRAVGHGCAPREKTSAVRERLITAIRDDGIEILALDECSHCVETGANLSPRTAVDHFKSLVDATGIVLVLGGLPKFQKLIIGNEQVRDRSLKTIEYHPYRWTREEDVDAFVGAFLATLEILQEAGLRIEFDELDMARRIYGASGGRVGMMLRIMKASLFQAKEGTLTFDAIARGWELGLQGNGDVEPFFASEEPSDTALVRSYAAVMHEADVRFAPATLDEFEAARLASLSK